MNASLGPIDHLLFHESPELPKSYFVDETGACHRQPNAPASFATDGVRLPKIANKSLTIESQTEPVLRRKFD